jgi:hypothetical protein
VSIRYRLAIVMMLATAVAVSLGGWIFVTTLSDRLHTSLRSELQARADAVSQQLQESPPVTTTAPGSGPDLSDSQSQTAVIDWNGDTVSSTGIDPSSRLLDATQLAQARRGTTITERRLPGAQASSLILAEPASDDKPYVVVVGASLATVDSAVSQVERVIVVGGSIGVLIAGFAAWLLAGAALAPVERMRRQAAEISGLDQRAGLEVPGTHDEIAALAKTLNDLLERLHATLRVQRSFVAAAGHELRTPLAILRAELELAGHPGRSRDELVAAIDGAGEETDRLIHLAEDLLLLARSDDASDFVRPLEVDLVPIVGGILAAQQVRADAAGVRLELEGSLKLPALADAPRFRQAIDNIIDNALRFAPRDSTVTVRVYPQDSVAVVEISDRGPGFDPEFLPRAFERFSRPDDGRDRDDGGAGLGLSIVHSIVQGHSGTVSIANRPGGGSRVRIRIPGVGGGRSGRVPAVTEVAGAPSASKT